MNLHCIDEIRCENGELPGNTGHGKSAVTPQNGSGAQLSEMLSKRQQEILMAACGGLTDKIIADKLGVSPRTLEGHWRAIHRKLGSINRCQAGFLFAVLRENVQGKAIV